MLIMTAEVVDGQLVDQAFTQLVVEKVAGGQWKKPVLFEIEHDGSQYRLFWDKLTRRRSALVLGAGHISQPLTAMLAMTDYGVTVVDDRPDFANTSRFPMAESVICQDFIKALEELNLSSYGAIIVVTRGHRSDMDCLRAVIAQPAAYVGMIGSQGRVRIVMNTLIEEGIDREALARLRAPIGLDIGAETPAEIALSIVSEIVSVNRSGSCRPLSDKWRCKS
jgi:xanthine dehydrogenase accessory factor